MKKINYMLLLFNVLLAFPCSAQWMQLNSGTNNDLSDVQFVNDSIGFVTGAGGLILKTANYGLAWTNSNNTSASAFFKDIDFPSDSIGYALHENDFYKTINQGTSWQLLPYINSRDKRRIFFTNDSTGYFISAYGNVHKTTDGGYNWISNNTGCGATIDMNDIFFFDENNGYFVGWYVTCFSRTNNAGATWQVNRNIGADLYRLSISFPAADVGYMTGRSVSNVGYIMKTLDSGSTWQTLITGYVPALNSIYCSNSNTCYAVGDSGIIIKTTDGGMNWQHQSSGTLQRLRRVFCINANTCYAIGDRGTILKTTNGGDTVVRIPAAVNNEIIKVFPNPVHNELIIQNSSNKSFQFTLYNSLGEKIIDKSLKNNTSTIDLSAYSNGIYFYKLISDKQLIKSGKIIKQ